MSDKIIHFGEFIRHHRINAGKTTEAFAREVKLTARRRIAIEAMAAPDVQHTTLLKLARALSMDVPGLQQAWQNTPVAITRRRPGPVTDSARCFAAACRTAHISPTEAMRRMRAWLLAQDAQTQRRILCTAAATEPSAEPLYTDLVDHLQDPAEEVRRRAARTAKKTQPPGPSVPARRSRAT